MFPDKIDELKESITAGLGLEDARPPVHNENMKRVNIRVTKEVHEFFKAKAEKTNITMSTLMYLALESYMQQEIVATHLPALIANAQNMKRNEEGKLAVS